MLSEFGNRGRWKQNKSGIHTVTRSLGYSLIIPMTNTAWQKRKKKKMQPYLFNVSSRQQQIDYIQGAQCTGPVAGATTSFILFFLLVSGWIISDTGSQSTTPFLTHSGSLLSLLSGVSSRFSQCSIVASTLAELCVHTVKPLFRAVSFDLYRSQIRRALWTKKGSPSGRFVSKTYRRNSFEVTY